MLNVSRVYRNNHIFYFGSGKNCSNLNKENKDSFVNITSKALHKNNVSTSFSKYSEKISNTIKLFIFRLGNKKEDPLPSKTIIPPCSFYTPVTEEEYISTESKGKALGKSYVEKTANSDAKIKPEYTPGELEIIPDVEDCIFISNFQRPHGSIAANTDLKGTIATSGLWQCSGVAFVDKKHDSQTLLHFAPGVNEPDNRSLLEYLLSYMKPEDAEITVVPGCYKETNDTVAYIVNTIQQISPDYNINFMNFPDHKHTCLILHNGELKCCRDGNVEDDMVNPRNIISYATTKTIPG